MSLFDQAISRLRNQAAIDKLKNAALAPLNAAATEPPKPARQKALDFDALRARGYLPEMSVTKQFADHFRRIKRPLIEQAGNTPVAGRDPRIIMVTSALPGDGKTFSSLNLALSFARERDLSVLLVDCDVIMRHISDILDLKGEPGLVDALTDESLDAESLVVGTNVRGMSVLPAGTTTNGTAELLSSNRLRQVIGSLCARAPRRLVLLDSPPLLITDEGRALIKIAGQVALVVRAGHTPRQAVLDAIGLFHAEQAGGIILNDVAMSRSDHYYGYGYGSYGPGADAT